MQAKTGHGGCSSLMRRAKFQPCLSRDQASRRVRAPVLSGMPGARPGVAAQRELIRVPVWFFCRFSLSLRGSTQQCTRPRRRSRSASDCLGRVTCLKVQLSRVSRRSRLPLSREHSVQLSIAKMSLAMKPCGSAIALCSLRCFRI